MSKNTRGIVSLEKIVSGGQTGVDRAALDAARETGLRLGGWCPAGRRSEDGRIPDTYPLKETESREYHVRTRRNVEESDGTMILSALPLTGGTRLTRTLALQMKKPLFVADPVRGLPIGTVEAWLRTNGISVLNVAGPRASRSPGIYDDAKIALEELLYELHAGS